MLCDIENDKRKHYAILMHSICLIEKKKTKDKRNLKKKYLPFHLNNVKFSHVLKHFFFFLKSHDTKDFFHIKSQEAYTQ